MFRSVPEFRCLISVVSRVSKARPGAPILLLILVGLTALFGCRAPQRDPHPLVFLIESSPTSLDPRIGTDSQSDRIDELLFDGLDANATD